MNGAKKLTQEMFTKIFEDPAFNEALIRKYFHPEYRQYADGNTLGLAEFIAHIKILKSALSNIKISFLHLIEESHSVCSVHIASGEKAHGKKVCSKIIAYFEIKNGQIILCDELSLLVEGDQEDKDLASRH